MSSAYADILEPECEIMPTPESLARDVYAIAGARLRAMRMAGTGGPAAMEAATLRQLAMAVQAAQQIEILAKQATRAAHLPLTDEEFAAAVSTTLRLVRG